MSNENFSAAAVYDNAIEAVNQLVNSGNEMYCMDVEPEIRDAVSSLCIEPEVIYTSDAFKIVTGGDFKSLDISDLMGDNPFEGCTDSAQCVVIEANAMLKCLFGEYLSDICNSLDSLIDLMKEQANYRNLDIDDTFKIISKEPDESKEIYSGVVAGVYDCTIFTVGERIVGNVYFDDSESITIEIKLIGDEDE